MEGDAVKLCMYVAFDVYQNLAHNVGYCATHRGELLGGCDIVMEMKQSGELRDTIEEMKARA